MSSATSSDGGGQDLDPRNRRIISKLEQTWLYFCRAMQQHFRPTTKLVVDYSLIAVMGLLIGVVFRNSELQKLPATNNFTSMAIGFTTIQSSLRLFGGERVVFWREVSSGSSRLAYFMGKNLADIPRLFLIPAMYLSLFSGFNNGYSNAGRRYIAILGAVWATSGIGYVASILFAPKNAQLGGVFFTLAMCLLSGFFPLMQDSSDTMKWVIRCSYARWLNEAQWFTDSSAYFDKEIDFAQTKVGQALRYSFNNGLSGNVTGACYTGEGKIESFITEQTECTGVHTWRSFHGDTWLEALGALVAIGLVARLLAFMLLVTQNRDKQI